MCGSGRKPPSPDSTGFEVHPVYDDFSTPTFDTRHNLIKGGSWISTGNEATRDSRYAFRRHFFQHAGFRYVASEQPVELPEAMYESDLAVSQYCEFHYRGVLLQCGELSAAVRPACRGRHGRPAEKARPGLGLRRGTRHLRTGPDLRRRHGLDFSARFIRIAVQMQEKGVTHYERVEEGDIVSYHERHLAEFGLDAVCDRVEFFQADATNLKPQFTGYDLILAANLIDRLYDPKKFLSSIHERLNMGGVLVLTSPYTWLEEFTLRENWVGGIRKDGEPYSTLDGLKDMLGGHFQMIGNPLDVEFVIRETRRKFQHTVSQMTAWERI